MVTSHSAPRSLILCARSSTEPAGITMRARQPKSLARWGRVAHLARKATPKPWLPSVAVTRSREGGTSSATSVKASGHTPSPTIRLARA